MFRPRIIPCLLLRGQSLVKTRQFKNPVYIGDPVNTVRIFSEKEVDELIVLDIDATKEGRDPNYELIAEIASECFMPLAYGGGIRTIEQVRKLIRSGVEKVILNSITLDSIDAITAIADVYGSQAVVAAIDVRKHLLGGYIVVGKSSTVQAKVKLDEHVRRVVAAGAGEIFINSVDRDGTMKGYDLDLIQTVAQLVNTPIVACGGAGTIEHFQQAVSNGATAVSAGSMFVFHGKHRAVLINYPQSVTLS